MALRFGCHDCKASECGLKKIQLRFIRAFRRFFPAPRFAGGDRFDSAIWLLQTRKDFLCAVENFPWQTGQTRDVDSVAFVRAAGDDFAQENDLLVPFRSEEHTSELQSRP